MNGPAFTRISTDDRVIITAKDDDYGFVDGWRGRVTGWHGSYAEVKCKNPDDVEVTLYVPPEQLTVYLGAPV